MATRVRSTAATPVEGACTSMFRTAWIASTPRSRTSAAARPATPSIRRVAPAGSPHHVRRWPPACGPRANLGATARRRDSARLGAGLGFGGDRRLALADAHHPHAAVARLALADADRLADEVAHARPGRGREERVGHAREEP